MARHPVVPDSPTQARPVLFDGLELQADAAYRFRFVEGCQGGAVIPDGGIVREVPFRTDSGEVAGTSDRLGPATVSFELRCPEPATAPGASGCSQSPAGAPPGNVSVLLALAAWRARRRV